MSDNSNKIQNILKTLPPTCGVYKMKDKQSRVIYVGKAKNLKKRVSSYFQKKDQQGGFAAIMVKKVFDIGYIETESELEALILETNLIKELCPRYNIRMKDDKNFIYIKVTVNEDFPRICLVRRIEKDGAKYFGPKTSVLQVRETLDLVRKLFPVRNCNLGIKDLRKGKIEIIKKTINYPCLEYHIKKCIAPCVGNCSRKEYWVLISNVLDFLSGKAEKFLKELEERMQEAASNKKFEQAAALRDKFLAVSKVMEKQRISVTDHLFQDVIGYIVEGDKAYFNLFMVRDGKLLNQENFVLEGAREHSKILDSFLKQYYLKASDIPAEILIPEKIEDKRVIEKWLSDLKKNKVKIVFGRNSHDKNLLDLSQKNAESYAKQMRVKWEQDEKRTSGANDELAKMLKIKRLKRIECFDISHFSGKDTVGSMVVFENGKPKRKDYRHFKLKSIQRKIDDYKALEEVLQRRLKYLEIESKDYRFSKVGKNDWEKVLKIIYDNKDIFNLLNLRREEFRMIKKNKEIVAFGRLRKLDDHNCLLRTLWVAKKERGKKLGYLFMRRLILASNYKKVYVFPYRALKDYYLKFGFREVKDVSDLVKSQIKPGVRVSDVIVQVLEVSKLKKSDFSFTSRPDLIVVDGGKGQLSILGKVLKKFGLKIPIMALAKKEEEIFLERRSLKLEKDSLVLQLLQRIRDEAHRFAIEHNRGLRNKNIVQSSLDNIPGVGDKMRTKLLNKFGSVAKIKEVSVDDLGKIVGKKLAERIKDGL